MSERTVLTRAFVQARMSSRRFPGKILAPFAGKPIIFCVIERLAVVIPRNKLVVLSSTDQSDDPLVSYVEQLDVPVFRGPLEDVFKRFQLCLQDYPCDFFVRVCADSPLLDPSILREMMSFEKEQKLDLITNVFPRTFPKGLSLEILKSETFSQLATRDLTPAQREHVTKVYYDDSEAFNIFNFKSSRKDRSNMNYSVDTIEDLHYLQDLVESNPSHFSSSV